MRRVIFTNRFAEQVAEIVRYIAQDDVAAARRIEARLWEAGDSLADFPERGRLVPHGARELTTVRPYVIRYRVTTHRVEVFAVRHGARRR